MSSPVAAAVVVSRGRLLLVRQDGSNGQMSWQLPQGVVSDGESAADTVVRETLRAAGMTVQVIRTLGEAPDTSSGRLTIYLACTPIDDASFPEGVDDPNGLEWCGQAELLHRLPAPFADPVQRYIDTSVG